MVNITNKFIVENSPPLKGVVRISGAKNSVLPIVAASLLTQEQCIIREVPCLSDVLVIKDILIDFGVCVDYDSKTECMTINARHINKHEADYELVSKIRASFLIMGPLLARLGKVRIPLPGGCQIGARPIELHLKGFSALGAKITQDSGFVEATAEKLIGANIYLDFPSVGATENIMMAAVLAEGLTTIQNCAVEPEIVDLANFLISLGADIKGSGTDTIRIKGVTSLKGFDYTIIPDRIEAGTFMVAAALTKGDIIIENIVYDHLKPVIAKLTECNVEITTVENGLRIIGNEMKKSIDLKTMPYPGFPTDMQAQMISYLSTVQGTSVVVETVFENRFMMCGELKRMGADITVEGRTCIIEGVSKLNGTNVKATDLRAGAGLIISALGASGTTEISDIFHIERGYCGIDKKLIQLGARIKLVEIS